MAHFAANAPTALYRLYDAAERLLYVGISTQPETRWTQHATDKPWWSLVRRRAVEWHPDRAAAEGAERSAVQTEEPLYNTAGARTSLLAAHFPVGGRMTQAQARLRIADVLDGSQFRSTHTEITRRGKPAGYVVPPEWYGEAVEALAEKRRMAVRSSPPAATSRRQVTQAVAEPLTVSARVAALPADRVKELADAAEARHPEWVEEIRQAHPSADKHRMHYLIVEAGLREGFRPPELADTERPVSSEENNT